MMNKYMYTSPEMHNINDGNNILSGNNYKLNNN